MGLMFLKLGALLADEDGHKQAFCTRGANAVFPCFTCHNVCGTGAKSVVREGETFFVDLTCVKVDDMRGRTDAEVWENADTLAELHRTEGPKACEKKAVAYGLNYVPAGLLWALALRPVVRPVVCSPTTRSTPCLRTALL